MGIVVESQRRTWSNRVKRQARYYWKRYAQPKKIARKLRTLFGS